MVLASCKLRCFRSILACIQTHTANTHTHTKYTCLTISVNQLTWPFQAFNSCSTQPLSTDLRILSPVGIMPAVTFSKMGQRCQKTAPTPSLSFNWRPQTRLPITVLTLDQSAGTFPEIAEATTNLESLQPIGGHGNLQAQRAGACAIVSALKGLSLTPLPSSFCIQI